ncbi:MAG: zinc-ribbon domain-containing protein [Desulfosarcinaceae bacterium]
MDIICQQCNATYHFPESRVPNRKAHFACKRCGKRLTIEPPASTHANDVRAASPAGRAHVASRTAGGQNNAITGELPEAAAFAPERYALDQLLAPDKKGRYKTRLNKFKLKLLDAVRNTLDKLLEEDEQVVHVAAATAYYPIELIFGNGWLTMLYNRYIIVATNHRLVALNSNYKMNKPTHYLFQFPYGTIKKVSRGIFGTSLTLTRKKGKRRTFTAVKRALAGEMKTFISANIDPAQGLEGKTVPLENLCPACYSPLPGKLSSCPDCRALFKSPRKAALRSLLLPGLGDIYLGHRFLGGSELLGSLLVWGVAASLFFSNDPADLYLGIIFLLFYNIMDGLVTLHMAKKGYSLENRQSQSVAPGRLSTSQA